MVLDAVPARDVSFEAELQRQRQNETLRVEFAEIANEVGAYIEARSAALAELSMQGKDTMEAQLEALKEFQTETMGYQPRLDQAEAANQVSWCARVGGVMQWDRRTSDPFRDHVHSYTCQIVRLVSTLF